MGCTFTRLESLVQVTGAAIHAVGQGAELVEQEAMAAAQQVGGDIQAGGQAVSNGFQNLPDALPLNEVQQAGQGMWLSLLFLFHH